MANPQYYSIFTTQGLALLREAIQNGTKLGITAMSFGDGNGIVPEPNAEFKKLVNEVYKTPLNRLAPSSNNKNWLEADAVIPSAVGGFNIREVGLWAGNVLVAYANYPSTYKPSADQGTAQIKTIRIVLQIDNTANFELKIDASVVMATQENLKEEVKKNTLRLTCLNDLRKTVARDLSDLVKTESYYKGLGKGSNEFVWDAFSTEQDNGGTIIKVDDVEIGRWKSTQFKLNPYMFGAYGDFVPEQKEIFTKGTGHDDTDAFQRMFNTVKYSVFKNNISKINWDSFLNPTFEWFGRNFLITDTLHIRTGTELVANGNPAIFFNPNSAIDLFSPDIDEMLEAYKTSTGWNTQSIYNVVFEGGVFIGNITKTSTIHAQKCFNGANACKWVLKNLMVERFEIGAHLFPLDTSAWTGGNRIGNFYENEIINCAFQECKLGLWNQCNVTHASNLTIGGGYIVGASDATNIADYYLINGGAGFCCSGFNIAPTYEFVKVNKAIIKDGCLGSSYTGGYVEWINGKYFELSLQDRFGGFSYTASHVFKYINHVVFGFSDTSFSQYNYATETRSVPEMFKNGRLYSEYLNTTGYIFGAPAKLLTDFFKYCPQYDFKFGAYGMYVPEDLTIDVKRFEKVWTGFTSKYGIRVLNFSNTIQTIKIPVNNKTIQAKICILYRNIKNFDPQSIKLNVLNFNNTNNRISCAEDVIDYGNGWKLAVLNNTNEYANSGGTLDIDVPALAQVEFEHIGAYADGFPVFPVYDKYAPKIDSINDRLTITSSGASLDVGDFTEPFVLNDGKNITNTNINFNIVTFGGTYNRSANPDIAISIESVYQSLLLSKNPKIKRCGIGSVVKVQQSSIVSTHRIISRNFSNGVFYENVKVETITGNPIEIGNIYITEDFVQQPILKKISEF